MLFPVSDAAIEKSPWFFMVGWQFFLIVWPIHKSIKRDLEEEKQQRPHWEVRAEEFGHSAGVFEDDHADEQAITEALQQDDIRLDQLNDFDDEDDDLFD